MIFRHMTSEVDTTGVHVWTNEICSVFVEKVDGTSDEYFLEDLTVQELKDVVENADGMEGITAEAYLTFVRATGRVPDLDTWADMPVLIEPTTNEIAQLWFDDMSGELMSQADWDRFSAYLDCEAIAANEFKNAVHARGPSGRAFFYLPDWTTFD